ncbi:MAG TPA: ABC transporter permease [Chloroflexota bacterium]|jgi:osmoprotectant transport system permease protein|nr:ABC transporter permease [Chloroflexota bacterium]
MSPGEPLIRWDWTIRHLPDIALRLEQHLILTGIAVGVGFAIALIVGIWADRLPRLYGPVTWVAGVLYTIPSLALFALLIPWTGLSLLTAEIGLVSYTLLILIRNVVAGLQAVPPDVLDAARGVGYTRWQILWRVELPLATAVILAGVRVATITTIGLVTVTALIGQGGLGFFILQGIQQFFSTPLIIGAGLSVLLAVLVDALLVQVERLATPWARART